MNTQALVSILLVFFVLIEEGRVHGGEDRVYGREQPAHDVEAKAHRRMVFKKGDHLFNNIAKAFTKMIRDIFTETKIHRFCTTRAGVQFIVEDTTDKNKDVTNLFPVMADSFREYATDKLLTTDRDSLSVYGQEHNGPDENAIKWSANIKDVRRNVFALIDNFVQVGIEGQPRPRESLALINNLQKRIDEIINKQEYVDKDAMKIFIKKQQNMPLVLQVEKRSEAVLRDLPGKANRWAVEAKNFIIKKFSGKK
ncbi:uncharacterized protein LOC116290106 [Actinia tenebrosa]|uniref:Uncharacterized protein LOC116290106 n=1 Tax=Actinia tenebrosa TaxID=6105 RepID=A0A6P8HK34_ACTTE|nr:uncharacterized protein LOC116290106 [Actinia tenebrosa]